MPYIKKHHREIFDDDINEIIKHLGYCPGEFNYVITRIVRAMMIKNGLDYSAINEMIGVFECAKLELYRRIAVPYEDSKMVKHGDVYED